MKSIWQSGTEFKKFPSLGALYNYQKQQDELYKQKYPYYNQMPETQHGYGNSDQH